MRAYVCDLNKKLHQFQDGWYDPVIFNKFEMEQMIIVQNVSGSYQVLWSQLINFELATYCSDPEASLAFSSIIWQPGPESESVFCNLPTGSHTGAWVRGWKMTNNKHTVKKRKHIIIWRDCTSARSKYGLFGCPRGSNWQGRGIYQLKLLLLPSCQKKKKNNHRTCRLIAFIEVRLLPAHRRPPNFAPRTKHGSLFQPWKTLSPDLPYLSPGAG